MTNQDASDGSSSYGSYCTALSDDDDDSSSCSTTSDDEEPLVVGYWSQKNDSLTDSERMMEMCLVDGSDLALHVVLAVIMNQIN